MKKLILILVLAIGFMSFTSIPEAENQDLLISESKITAINTSACDYYERTCYYRGGVLIGCTAWTCVIELDEVVIRME